MRSLVVLLFVAVSLAGCVTNDAPAQPASLPGAIADDAGDGQEPQPAPEAEPAGQTPEEPAQVDPEALPIEGGTMLASVTPEHPVAAYAFSIDEDAAHPYYSDTTLEQVFLSVAPIYDEAPEAMIVSLHRPDGILIASRWMVPVTGTSYLTAALPASLDGPANLDPFTFLMSEGVEGADVVVVVAAKGLTAPAGALLRIDDELTIDDDARSIEFLEEHGVWAPAPLGTGTGYTASQVLEVYAGIYAPVGLTGSRVVAGDVDVDERGLAWQPPHGGHRDVTMDISSPGGWGYATVAHYGGAGVLEWDYGVRAGGQAYADDGIMPWVGVYGLTASSLLWGLPIATAMGDGEGASASLTTAGPSTNDLYVLLATAMAYDQSWEELTGEPATPAGGMFEGLLLDLEGRTTTVGGTSITIA